MAEMTINELNAKILGDSERAILEAERDYHTRVSDIADYVRTHEKIRIILLAGPSGSGKTTSANLIQDAIKSRGEECIVVSLDDFYRDSTDKDYPRREDGERDFECPEALHLDEVSRTLMQIARGEDFALPRYDFKIGKRASVTQHAPMPHGCVIIEGLHALNPKIWSGLDGECVIKIFVSVSTNISDEGDRIISGRKIRFVRRLVRDSIYRGADAVRTLGMWRHVLAAEDVYLYPYKELADIAFDTFHCFEMGVMRSYALNLLTEELAGADEYVKIVRRALEKFLPVDEGLVPQSSLIREFIPGGIYEQLY